jgi:membrane-associated phospholipid phosphatase
VKPPRATAVLLASLLAARAAAEGAGDDQPTFQLRPEIDLPVLGVSLVFASARLFQTDKAFCAPLCNPDDVNALDRTTAGTWNTGWQTASDVGVYVVTAGAAALLVADEGLGPAANDVVVIAESALGAMALGNVMTLAVARPRPFLYGTEAPLAERNSTNASFSFVSSHTSFTAATAISTYMTLHRRHPGATWPNVVLGVGLAATAFVGSARVLGGAHFISDAVAGAIVGVSVGVLVPSLHAAPVSVVPLITPTEKGIGVQGRL